MKELQNTHINELLIKTGLYEKFHYNYEINYETGGDLAYLIVLICSELKIDCYCTECKRERLFVSEEEKKNENFLETHWENDTLPKDVLLSNYSYFCREFVCHKESTHKITFFFKLDENTIMKVGQYPSLADLSCNEIDKYKQVLSKSDLSDLSRAIGLQAHGIGAGSFVYLRRIFENLIEKAYKKCLSEGIWDKSIQFNNIAIKEKIDILKEYLPSFLFENPIIYGLLSAGIHSLDEKWCYENFNILKETIMEILDEDIRINEKEKRRAELSKLVNKMSTQIGMNKNTKSS